MTRKTITIKALIGKANHMLATSTIEPAGRHAICSFIEGVLSDAGAYAGFRYLRSSEVPAGQLPGVKPGPDLQGHTFPDDSRRAYYDHRKLG